MLIRAIPGLTPTQSEQARALLEQILLASVAIAGGDEAVRRRVLKCFINRVKVQLDGVSAPEKVKLAQPLRERQGGICPVCGLELPVDPDAVEKHRLNRSRGYADPSNIELRHRKCHRSEHAAEQWR
jgi:hypothetical protein